LIFDLDGLGQVMLDDLADAVRKRRREERDLLLLRHLLQDVLDVLDETHAQHLICLVEHHGLERAELQASCGAR
jgi:hypothetical protein